jgi:tryptophan-rich sensory protein
MKIARNIMVVFMLYMVSSLISAFVTIGMESIGVEIPSGIYSLLTLLILITLITVWEVDKKNAKTSRVHRL